MPPLYLTSCTSARCRATGSDPHAHCGQACSLKLPSRRARGNDTFGPVGVEALHCEETYRAARPGMGKFLAHATRRRERHQRGTPQAVGDLVNPGRADKHRAALAQVRGPVSS